jgi:hypothetical protein
MEERRKDRQLSAVIYSGGVRRPALEVASVGRLSDGDGELNAFPELGISLGTVLVSEAGDPSPVMDVPRSRESVEGVVDK